MNAHRSCCGIGAGVLAILLIIGIITAHTNVLAVSLHPDLVEKMRADCTLDEYVRNTQAAREKGVWATSERTYLLSRTSDESPDTMRIVVLLVDFSDNEWTDGPAGTVEFFEDLLFSEDVVTTGSMKEYYLENSYDGFVLTGDIHGWYRMPETYVYYVNGQAGFGAYPQNVQKLVEDAVQAADPDIDFSLYDNSGDGWVDGLLVVHAGQGRETSGSNDDIHSHQWYTHSTQYCDGVYLRSYMVVPEENYGTSDNLVSIGIICHEFGHLIGDLPDLYDIDYSSEGLGNWSVMAGGSWNNNGQSPAHFDPWCKSKLGFLQPENITENMIDWEFARVEDSPNVARLWKYGAVGTQYFLVENRQKVGFDSYIPGEGLLLYHIDETQMDNSDETHYLVAIEQADGLFQLENNVNSGNSGDPYPGSSDTREFTDLTTPSSREYSGLVTEVAMWNISDSDSLMTADLDIEFSRPMYYLTESQFEDVSGGDGDGVLELGETIDFYFVISNIWAEAAGVTGSLIAADPRLNFTISSVNIGTVPAGGTGDNYGSPLQFQIPSDMDTIEIEFYLTITQASYDDSSEFVFEQNIGGATVLIIDDDQGIEANYEHYFTDALDSLNVTCEVWGKDTLGSPGVEQIDYPIVMWLTGDHRDTTLTPSDREFIRDYLDGGGKLFITGQDIAEHLSVEDPALLSDYFMCTYGGSSGIKYEAAGQAASVIGAGEIKLTITGTDDAAGNQVSPDYLIPFAGSRTNFTYYPGDEESGVEIATDIYRVVFFGFGFEAINNAYAHFEGYESRETVMGRILSFFGRSYGGLCGDADASGGVDIDDIVYLIAYIFSGGPPPEPLEVGDVDCSGGVDIDDVVYLIAYVFSGGPVPCDPDGDSVPEC